MRFAIPLCGSFFCGVTPYYLWDETGLCRKTIFQVPKNCFFRTCLHCFQSEQNRYVDRRGDLKHRFHTALMKLREAWLCKKKSGSKKKPHCSHETQTSPALQKTIFQALKNHFFRMPLVKSANSTSLPRLSSLQIVQMQCNT